MQRLSDHVYFIEGENRGRYPFCNCLFVKDETRALIDTGAGKIIKNIEADCVFNSHWHEDHITYNSHFNKIFIHEKDAEAAESYNEFKKRYGLSDELLKPFIYFKFSKVSKRLKDGDRFDLGSTTLSIIYTPGHSQGHCCFLVEDNIKIIYLSDIDLSSFGPWYGCLDSDLQSFIESINKIKEIVESENVKIVVSSHREVLKDKIVDALDSYLNKIFKREEKLLGLLKKGRRIDELVGKGIIYRKFGEPKKAFEHFERVMLEQHLDRLLKLGKVDRVNEKWISI
ncbi:MAG: MBL fold metallo-hydrolase [Archaeoglobaceae archaeon]|nr:MBL fold metallo-hydrolase [Archaeoglobaceae archaeon]